MLLLLLQLGLFIVHSLSLSLALFFRLTKFQNIHRLVLFVSENFDGDCSHISYIGLKGIATKVCLVCHKSLLLLSLTRCNLCCLFRTGEGLLQTVCMRPSRMHQTTRQRVTPWAPMQSCSDLLRER